MKKFTKGILWHFPPKHLPRNIIGLNSIRRGHLDQDLK